MGPTASVCIPAFQSEDHIAATIESVLAQTLPDVEIVIVDDASTDLTLEVVGKFDDDRIRVERNPDRLGLAGNWNRSVELAQGRYVKVLCHDDVLYPTCLASQVAAMEAHPEVALVAGKRDIVDPQGRVLVRGRGLPGLTGVVASSEAIRRTVRSGTNLFGEPLAVLLRRDLLPACGRFSDQRPYMIDLEYWCRMLRFGPLFAQQETVGEFRVTTSSLSAQLVRDQRRQAIGLLRDLRREHSGSVAATDVPIGAVRSVALAFARAMGYRVLQLAR
jgi:glycosyltransferase involved in cell wall biosynthesis